MNFPMPPDEEVIKVEPPQSWFQRLTKFFSHKNTQDAGLLGHREKFFVEKDEDPIPWAIFEIVNFDGDGKVKVEFNWNSAFIKRLDELGFTAETEEDTVQLFFYTSQMQPTDLNEDGDKSVHLEDLPALSQNVNRVAR